MKLGYCLGYTYGSADTFIPFLAQLGYDGIELTVIPATPPRSVCSTPPSAGGSRAC
jgi:hypothetical protein